MRVQGQTEDDRPSGKIDLLAIGCGTTVAMWAVAYVGHMPLVDASPAVFVSLMLLCVVGGGLAAGRWLPRDRAVRGGLGVGAVVAMLNLLILGSVLRQPDGGAPLPVAWLWIPGWFALSLGLAGVGSLAAAAVWPATGSGATTMLRTVPGLSSSAGNTVGQANRGTRQFTAPFPDWLAVQAWITCVAAVLLLAAGGLVTGFRAGMAVPDWPNTYGSNMFLYPLARMTGGVFYEHTHRLLGTLVGAAALILAIYVTRASRDRKGLVRLVWIAGACVAIQGTMGGFRVTDDSHCLAVAHGCFAHAVLGMFVAVAVLLSGEPTGDRPGASDESDRFLTALLVGVVLVQTLLGTLVRQLDASLLVHVTVAAVVALVSAGAGMRAWGLSPRRPALRRCGIAVLLLVVLQINLGIVSLAMRTPPVGRSPSAAALQSQPDWLPVRPLNALLTTAHQTTAALILAVAVGMAVSTRRATAAGR